MDAVSKFRNPLGEDKISKLLKKIAVPAMISYLIGSLYNIVDQIFIGRGIGYIGNAATNVSFPITVMCMAIAMWLGNGCAANFNLELGRNNKEKAAKIVGTTFSMLIILALILTVLVNLFLKPMMIAFGATNNTLYNASLYARITSISMVFLIFSSAVNNVIRGDGSPKYAMAAMSTGAIVNSFLDPLFIFVFHWGMAGAASATVIGQTISGIMMLSYIKKFKSINLKYSDFIPRWSMLVPIMALGLSSLVFNLSSLLVQIVMNNTLKKYGSISIYGSDIPIAVYGIVMKITAIFNSFLLGVVVGAQPIFGFNYGAKNYQRVIDTFKLVIKWVMIISLVAFVCIEFFPTEFIGLFGSGNKLYMEYGVRFLRIYRVFIVLIGIHGACTLYFAAVGKAKLGAILSLSRQIIILPPCIVIFSMIGGINAVVYSGPVADLVSCLVAGFFIVKEMKFLNSSVKEEARQAA